MVVRVLADDARGTGVPDDDIGIGASSNHTLNHHVSVLLQRPYWCRLYLARVDVEALGGVGAGHGNELVGCQLAGVLCEACQRRI